MNKQNAPLIVLLLVAGLAAFFAFSFNNQRAAEQKLRLKKEFELKEKQGQIIKIASELSDLRKEKTETEAALQAKIADLEAGLKTNDEQVKNLTASVEALTNDKTLLQKDVADKQKSIDELGNKLRNLEMDKADLLNTLKKFKSGELDGSGPEGASGTAVNLGNIVVQKTSGTNAKVQDVNKQFGFIVVNAGGRDGLVKGSAINIVRNNHLIGKAIVQKIRDGVSAAALVPDSGQEEIQVGDGITFA